MVKTARKNEESVLEHPAHNVEIAEKPLTPTTLKKHMAAVKKEVSREKHFNSSDDEKATVLEIIADLEKQLEIAFSIKDTQEAEIARLEKEYEKECQKSITLDTKLKEHQELLVSQEKLNFNLEFLENERLQMLEQIKALKEELQSIEELKKNSSTKMDQIAKDVKTREMRIEQMELELNTANETIQNFQNRIHKAEEEKESFRTKLETIKQDIKTATDEKEAAQKDLQKAKESLEEIRTMLTETRAKAKGRYYKK